MAYTSHINKYLLTFAIIWLLIDHQIVETSLITLGAIE